MHSVRPGHPAMLAPRALATDIPHATMLEHEARTRGARYADAMSIKIAKYCCASLGVPVKSSLYG